MQDKKVVQNYLELAFPDVKLRETDNGFRFNKESLNKIELTRLDCIPVHSLLSEPNHRSCHKP